MTDWKAVKQLHDQADSNFGQMQKLLQECMRLTFPGRNFWYQSSPDAGNDKETYIFDNTAKFAANIFVSSLSELLFPKQFFSFVVGEDVPMTKRAALKIELERLTSEYHKLIEQTFYKTSISEALADTAISTGFLEIRENKGGYNLTHPISFHASALCKTRFLEHDGCIVSTWLDEETYFYAAKNKYPYVDWSQVSYQDSDLVSIVDGCVYMPRDDEDKSPFIFYVCERGKDEKPLYSERRDYPYRFGFGMDKYAIGDYRQGQVLKMLDTIRMANAIAEMNWIAIQYTSMPIMLTRPEFFENPAMTRLVPGATIKLNSYSALPGQPFPQVAYQVPVNLNSQSSQLQLESFQQNIMNAFFATPTPSANTKVRTATEIDILNNARVQGINRSARRLKGELLDQFIRYSTKAFRRAGYLVRDNPKENFTIDSENIAIEYHNIFEQSENLEVMQNLETYRQSIQAWAGEEMAIQTIDMAMLPSSLAEYLNLPVGLVKSEAQLTKVLKAAQKAAQQQAEEAQQQAQVAQGQQPPQPQNSAPVNPLSNLSAPA